ncbi:hypothetical protein MKW92_022692 [Papaver armeniacum]|nr:hypothetical protein MKW92_022692 [Papaver armeniacum]
MLIPAVICNITLAQIHTDETKSSLQFASRTLCVTNSARVNKILTDAALLKHKKKEIEELRGKLKVLTLSILKRRYSNCGTHYWRVNRKGSDSSGAAKAIES